VPPSSLLVTGPLAYDRLPSDFIAIGDAAGMIDPFCGEGMRHALDTGICAARIIALGMRCRESYATMRALYEAHSAKRWRNKRVLGRFIRHMLQHPRITSLGLHLSPEFWFRQLWA
jgi:flavin-dependent dehydrogenase